jgi:hypothetical protein
MLRSLNRWLLDPDTVPATSEGDDGEWRYALCLGSTAAGSPMAVAVSDDNCNSQAVELMLGLLQGAWAHCHDEGALVQGDHPLDSFSTDDMRACVRRFPKLVVGFLKVLCACRVSCARTRSACMSEALRSSAHAGASCLGTWWCDAHTKRSPAYPQHMPHAAAQAGNLPTAYAKVVGDVETAPVDSEGMWVRATAERMPEGHWPAALASYLDARPGFCHALSSRRALVDYLLSFFSPKAAEVGVTACLVPLQQLGTVDMLVEMVSPFDVDVAVLRCHYLAALPQCQRRIF